MGRAGVIYEQVAEAANALLSQGRHPTQRSVREQIGEGSHTTIQQHLSAWRKQQQSARPLPTPELPIEVVKTLNGWMQQTSTAARSKAEEAAAILEDDLSVMTQSGEKAEKLEVELMGRIAEITRDRDQAKAVADARAMDIERLTVDMERERDLAGRATVDAAQAKLKAEAQAELLAELKSAQAKLSNDLETVRQELAKAEKDAAVLQTRLAATSKDADGERERAKVLQIHLDAARAKDEAMRTEFDKRLAAERTALDKANNEGKTFAIANAELRAKLEATQQTLAHLQPEQNLIDKSS